jgi:hypothetical protein
MCNDSGCQLGKGNDLVHRTHLDGHLGHAEDNTALFILGNGFCPGLFHFQQSLCPVITLPVMMMQVAFLQA